MDVDRRYSYLKNAKGERFQVLKPIEYGQRPKVDAEGYPVPALDAQGAPSTDERGFPLYEMEEVELPRDWDEAATYKAMNGG